MKKKTKTKTRTLSGRYAKLKWALRAKDRDVQTLVDRVAQLVQESDARAAEIKRLESDMVMVSSASAQKTQRIVELIGEKVKLANELRSLKGQSSMIDELRDQVASLQFRNKKSFLINHKLVDVLGLLYERDEALVLGSEKYGSAHVLQACYEPEAKPPEAKP